MSWEPKVVGDFETEDATNRPIPDLIYSLKSAFQSTVFEQVERILVLREEKMKLERVDLEARLKKASNELSIQIENQKKEHDLLVEKYGLLELSKVEVEDKLKEYRRACDELKEENMRLGEDRRLISDREWRTEERYGKLKEEVKKEERDKKEVIVQLQSKNRDLESAKRRAEIEIEAWKKRFGELESRVLLLEKDIAVLTSGESLIQRKMEGEFGAVHVGSDELMGGKETKISKVQKETDVVTGSADSAHLQTNDKGSDCSEKISSLAGIGSPPCHFPIKGNEDLRAAGPHAIDMVYLKEEKESDPSDSEMKYKVPDRKQLFVAGSQKKMMVSTVPGSGRPASRGIIDISDSDSDDEMPRVNGTACVSIDRGSGGLLSGKEFIKSAWSDQIGEENGSSYMENCLLASTLKRKRASFINTRDSENDDKDVDDNTPTDKCKTRQRQKLIQEFTGSPVNHRSATFVSSGSDHVEKSVTPVRQNPENFRRCGEKTGAEQNFRSHSNGFINEDSSSDSEDDSESYSSTDQFLSNILRIRDNKSWAFKADMLSAFEKDPELCMKAVCALYRQQTTVEKSMKRSPFSNNRGFNKFDALRGTALAEFLIDGDPQGKLKKSVRDLQKYDPKGLDDCKRLATQHSELLFEIYQKKEDPLFLPS